ncbi:kinase A anchor protein [Trametes punicea]|nr:kinase A anchor protein [Trametes punicea]
MTTFTDALLAATPPIPGLDRTIVIPPRRLHFTLGVMSLDRDRDTPAVADAPQTKKPRRTLEAAQRVLEELRPKIVEMLGQERLRVTLDSMDIMKPERGDQERAHVMWVGPSLDGESGKKLKAVADVIMKAFNDAGLLVDEKRPLKLHCTVLNTVYRKPRGKGRTPFSYPSVLASEAFKAVLAHKQAGAEETADTTRRGPVRVDFGEWAIDEVQICEMGSWGPEGEYVAVHRCALA